MKHGKLTVTDTSATLVALCTATLVLFARLLSAVVVVTTAVEVTPFKGPKYFAINDAMQQALTRVDVDKTDDPDSSWEKFVTAVGAL